MKMKALICILLSLSFSAVLHAQTDIPCEFMFAEGEYTCRLPQVDLTRFENFVITSNNHTAGQNDGTVMSFVSINNNFQTFPTQHIARFTNLRAIKITGSVIRELPPQSIANRGALRRLNLNSNSISSISPAAFTGTTGLEHIQLMFNLLPSIDNSVFGLFNNLVELELSSNLFSTIPQNTLNTSRSLATLSVSGNQIKFIHRNFFDNLLELRTFNFLTNPCYSAAFTNLHTATGRNEMMRRLEPCFNIGPRRLQCIFGYEFEGVSFDGLYTCLLRDIEVLDREAEIQLGGFHQSGRTNANVQNVWIDGSNVRYIINEAFSTFPNLRRMQIQGSNLEVLQPGAFVGAINLRELTILMNSVRRLEAYSFQHAVNLEIINLWFNSLESIDENAFSGLVNLKELHLFAGYLTTIPPYTFAPLRSLYLVEIGQNQLRTIDHRWFTNNTMIGQLLFNRNQINEIFPEILNITTLTTLRLRENKCIDNEFIINDLTRDNVREELRMCFDNYPLRIQRFEMEVEGDLTLIDENGRVVINL